MKIHTSYKIKIQNPNKSFDTTVRQYRKAVDFFIAVIQERWVSDFGVCQNQNEVTRLAEKLCHATAAHPNVEYDFAKDFYKFPTYLRRAAIAEAFGHVRCMETIREHWKADPKKKRPGKVRAGRSFPALYRYNMFTRTGRYTARVKSYIRNTWDWVDVELRKTDVHYIERYCAGRKECVPFLRRRGKNWFLEFSFEEKVTLNTVPIEEQTIVSVDVGINNACVCTVMRSDGTILGRRFLRLTKEQDRLTRSLARIRTVQKSGARKVPRLWKLAKGINDDISVKTARFITDTAVLYDAEVIVMEKLDLMGRKRGRMKQRLHHWRVQYVQQMVEHKAHRVGMRIRRVNARNTSKLAYDGSGEVTREYGKYSLCTFSTGKQYHSDLNASYNIGARYFVRELLKPLTETQGQRITAKVPECAKRSTCTLSTLFRLHAELSSI